MTDRELLELAAKAISLRLVDWRDDWEDFGPGWRFEGDDGMCDVWNPLTDHIAAERLRHALNIRLEFESYNGDDYACAYPPGTHQGYDELIADNSTEAGMLAADRAIVRAAAEIGRAMP